MAVLKLKDKVTGEWAEVQSLIGPRGEQGPRGEAGVVISDEEPADPAVNVWINSDGDNTLNVITPDDLDGSTVYIGEDGKVHAAGGESSGGTVTVPVKGVDYWTEEDKAAIIEEVLASLPSAEEVIFNG